MNGGAPFADRQQANAGLRFGGFEIAKEGVGPLGDQGVEPFVVPKKSLTGDNSERVDTRVLQVIYECDPAPDGAADDARRLFVGQQVDVSIEAPERPSSRGEAGTAAASGSAP